jgi:NAD(P)H-binding
LIKVLHHGRWKDNNGPEQTDLVSAGNIIRGAPRTLQHIAYCSSAGVERSGSFPFLILNIFGVLRFKRASEQLLQQSGLSYTIARPSRLTDGPYTSFDLNTLLKATSGSRQHVILSQEDDLLGEASRITTAEMLVQSLLVDELQGQTLALSTEEGQGPQSSADWAALVREL